MCIRVERLHVINIVLQVCVMEWLPQNQNKIGLGLYLVHCMLQHYLNIVCLSLPEHTEQIK